MNTRYRTGLAILLLLALALATGAGFVLARQQLDTIVIPPGVYCSDDTCLVIGDVVTLPPTTAAPSATPSTTPRPSATHTAIPSLTPSPSLTPDTGVTVTPTPEVTQPPLPTATIAPTEPPPSSEVCEVGIVVATLNVRPAPGDFSRVIARVNTPQRFPVDEIQWIGDDEWAHITLGDGRTGWIAVYYRDGIYAAYSDTTKCDDLRFPVLTPQPVLSPAPTFTPPSYDCLLIAPQTGWINVRVQPTVNSEDIGNFEGGAQTYALARYEGAERWYKVWWFNETGWVQQTATLTTEGTCDALPVEDPFAP